MISLHRVDNTDCHAMGDVTALEWSSRLLSNHVEAKKDKLGIRFNLKGLRRHKTVNFVTDFKF